jgi:predicted helicase
VRGEPIVFDKAKVRTGVYRPFEKRRVYVDAAVNEVPGQVGKSFPADDIPNVGFYCVGMSSSVPFSVLAVDALPNLHLTGAGSGGQFYSRYTYRPRKDPDDDLFSQLNPSADTANESKHERVDNITDSALVEYRAAYGGKVTKDDIFYFVYGLLHSPGYRAEFAADLTKMLPRLPILEDASDFREFASAGRELASLHIGYEKVEPFPLEEILGGSPDLRVKKMAFGKNKDRSRIIYNQHITLAGVPDAAYEYTIGSRSAIEWIMERYQVKTDKASGIVNDPNDWCEELGDPRYIVDLVKRVVTVSLETMKIVEALPPLRIRSA